MPALALALLLALQEERLEVPADRLEALAAEAVARVEEAAGRKFLSRPVVKLSTYEEVARALERELAPQLALLEPQLSEADRAKALVVHARAAAKSCYGKYEPAAKTVHLLAENFRWMPQRFKTKYSASYHPARVVLLHELVHAWHDQHHPGLLDLSAVKTAEQLSVRAALSEGHCQFIAEKAARAHGLHAAFVDLEALVVELPPNLDEAERVVAAVHNASHRFSYHDGKRFFEELAKADPAAPERALAKPPASRDVILFPRRFLDPAAVPTPGRDVAPLLADLAKVFGPGYKASTEAVDGQALRAGLGGVLPEARIAEGLARFAGGRLLALEADGGRKVHVEILEADSLPAGLKLYEFLVEGEKAFDESLRKSELVELARADWGTLKGARFGRNATVDRTIRDGDDVERHAKALVHAGRAAARVTWLEVEASEKDRVRILDLVTDYLSKPFVPAK